MRYTGVMSDIYLVVAIIFGVSGLIIGSVGLYRSYKISQRLDNLFSGMEENGTIEETLKYHFSNVKGVKDKLKDIQNNYSYLSNIAAASIQKTAIIRFNPFKHTGGDQSFVLALLDNHDNGLLLTSIHSREGTRIYIKPITYGSSDHTLSKEEKSALETAQGKERKDRQ